MGKRAEDWHDLEEEIEAHYAEERTRRPRPKRRSGSLVPGVIVRSRGHHFDVQTATGLRVCQVRGRLRQEKNRDTLVAVGDRVLVLPEGPGRGLIDEVEERHAVLSRQRPGASQPAEDVILANPDQVLVVFAVAQPEPHLRMLDRFLVIAEANKLPAIICANKVDLVDTEQTREIFGLYAEIGYSVIYTSVESGQGIDELRRLLAGCITVVAGPSGVGKSSLINTVHPDLNLRVGDLRDFEGKGRHTTRAAHLIPLPFGENSYIADTPGIRELGLYDIDPADLGFYFVEMKLYLHDCRYPDCTHDHEPDCAVRAAVESGHIRPQRYESYLRLLHGEE